MIVTTPPMGWNSWNTFGESISEELVMEAADALVSSGLRDAGYTYVVIDDCWSLRERNAEGKIVADPAKFPHGMKYLADYIHSKGLKFGMYSCAGTQTCAGYPGSFNHEFTDAQMFADFGVDFLKYDFCYKPKLANGPMLYNKMGMALRATGRDILYSACNWGSDDVWTWIRSTGAHMYRSTGDLGDNFQLMKDIAYSQIPKQGFNGPNCFNDPDMLIVGMYNKGNVGWGGCNDNEYMMHFSLWCMMSAPLMIGCDVRNISEEALKTLTNKSLLSIDQDPAVRQAIRVPSEKGDDHLILFKHLEGGDYAIAMYNFSESPCKNNFFLHDIGLGTETGYGLTLENIITGEKFEKAADDFGYYLEPHTCATFRAKVVPLK